MKRFLPLYILVLLFSCKNDNEIICEYDIITPCENPIPQTAYQVDTCFELPYDANGFLPVVPDYKRYFKPIFHPVIEDEFIFLAYKRNDSKIYKSNLCDEYFQEGFDMAMLPNPVLSDWNEEETLLLRSNFKIWKVDFNGDNLTQITTDNNQYYGAKWCMNDSLIYCYAIFDQNSPYYPYRSFLMNEQGDFIHVFDEGIGSPDSDIHDNKVITTSRIDGVDYIGYIDLNSKDFISIYEVPDLNGYFLGSFKWLDHENILYAKNSGSHQQEFKLNLTTLESTLIAEKVCENYSLGTITTAPLFDNKNVLTYQSEYQFLSPTSDSLMLNYFLIKKNIETGVEHILDINL